MLDLVGDEGTLGKPGGGDLRRGVATLPTLLHLERAPGHGPVRAVLAGESDPERVGEAIQDIRDSGAIEAALAEARGHANEGNRALNSLPQGGATDMLRSLATLVVDRSR